MISTVVIDRIKNSPTTRVGDKGIVVSMPSPDIDDSVIWLGVTQKPSLLASSAKLDLEDYSGARGTASEVTPVWTVYEHLAVTSIFHNEANARHAGSVFKLLCERTTDTDDKYDYSWTRGWFGEQKGRWAATRQDPNLRALAAFRAAEDIAVRNYFRGATKFFNPALQNTGKQGSATLSKNAEDTIRKWYKEGNRWVGPLAGIDHTRLMIFSKGDGESLETALNAASSIPFRASPTPGATKTVYAANSGALLAASLGALILL